MEKIKHKKFTSDELAGFCTQVSTLLHNGIPIYEGTYIMYSEMEDGETRKILEGIDNDVKEGAPLYKALENSGAFPEYMINMVQVGEYTGKLPDIMKALSKYYERENSVSMGVRSIIVYPTILFILMAVILTVLVAKILPMFSSVFYELKNKTKATENMMNFTLVGSRIITAIILVLAAVMLVFLIWYRTRKGAGALTDLLELIPSTKPVARMLGTANFLSAMSVMLSNGIETTEAATRAKEVVSNKEVSARISKCISLLESGEAFDDAIRKSEILYGMEASMIGVGLKAGCVDEVLAHISESMDEEVGNKMSELSATIETALVVALSVIVGIILVAVMLPLISVIASI